MLTLVIKNDELKTIIKKAVAESVQEVFTDPDFGLEISDDFKKRLLKYQNKKSKKFVSLAEIKKRYSLR